ncbi:MAG: protein translocase subunit SecD [Alphaproteobacteria bacterium]|nr:protein translocase subunit SecD [Alphaproteobacteria bacterium]
MIYFAKWKIILILVVCFFGFAFASPNLLREGTLDGLPDWLPHKSINLGLDLQGGSHLLLEVEVDAVIKERLESLVDSVRVTLRTARIGYKNLGVDGQAVAFTLVDPETLPQARELVGGLDADTVLAEGTGDVVRLTYTEQALKERRQHAVEQSIEIVRRRIDETGTREPTIQRQGTDRILVQLPGVKDPERIKKLLGKTAKLNFHLVDLTTTVEEAREGRIPPGSALLPSDEVGPDGQPVHYVIRKRIMVSGDTLVDAQPTFEDARPVVFFKFDSVGGRRFGEVTKNNIGKPFAIVLDGKVISAPVIRSAILGGSGIITGRFSVQEVQDLALLLRAGALPAPLTILEERTVGPGLGADSIRAGEIACVLGMILVVVFMAVIYGRFGIMADLALIVNMVLIAAALSLLQATLTLPGIAGIVLTIGMAVDANVLIFERIREESRAGRTPISAIDSGYRRALTTIIDSNLTTFIAAVLLFLFGSGPIKGFAVTLSIGLITSMFTAIMVTRLLMVTWLRRAKPSTLPI